MRVLHVLRNNKHGGTQIISNAFNGDKGLDNTFYFLEDPVAGYLSQNIVSHRDIEFQSVINTDTYNLIICYTGLSIVRFVKGGQNSRIIIHLGSRVQWSLKYYLYSLMVFLKPNVSIVVPSEVVRKSLKPYFFRRVYLIPNPLRNPFFDKSRMVFCRNEATMVGRIDVNDTARDWQTFCSLSREFPDLIWNAVGNGSLMNKLKARYNTVRFHGNLDVDNLISVLDQSKYFLFLNNEIEGFGIALYEALARGCIVIAPNIPINREIIQNDINGILFNQGSLKSTFHRVLSLTEAETTRLSKQAVESVSDYGEIRFVEKVLCLNN